MCTAPKCILPALTCHTKLQSKKAFTAFLVYFLKLIVNKLILLIFNEQFGRVEIPLNSIPITALLFLSVVSVVTIVAGNSYSHPTPSEEKADNFVG